MVEKRQEQGGVPFHATIRGKVVKAFVTAATEDNGGTKTTTNGVLSDRILCNLLDSSGMATCGSSLLRESRLKKSPTT